jgi:protein PhnA
MSIMSKNEELGVILHERGGSQCELCGSSSSLEVFSVSPHDDELPEHNALLCDVCRAQIQGENGELDSNHWYGLQETIWSETPVIQVLSWRMLHRLRGETWARDILDQAYLTDDVLEWAKQTPDDETEESEEAIITRDTNGRELRDGDSVTLVTSLDVRGTSFVAKQGTKVKNIRLIGDPDNIEGKINNVTLVLKTKFLKKV